MHTWSCVLMFIMSILVSVIVLSIPGLTTSSML